MFHSENFNTIPINTSAIPQNDLNIDERTRTNLFAWNGQFSPQFVEAELSKYAENGFLIVDPFLGSGTVLYECARKGLKGFGTELNASAYFMAKTYELCKLELFERWALFNDVEDIIYKAIKQEDFINYIVSALMSEISSDVKNILSALVILLDIYNNTVTKDLLLSKWDSYKSTIISLPFSTNPVTAKNGDARSMAIEDSSADLLLTSPPYINVFNYHQKYRASVEALGFNVLSIAKSEFGSNRKHRGNRLYTVIQYCIDIALSLKEANRVCKTNARMIYVVGRESTVLGYSFCNSELVYNLGTRIFGFDLDIRQERVFKNRYGQMIYEDILHFINNDTSNIAIDEIIDSARKIAVEMLESKLVVDNKNHNLLEDAISKAQSIKPSEVHYNA